jgi:hypothetical protein
MDGCIIKGCHPVLDFNKSFGEYASLLETLFQREEWGADQRGPFGLLSRGGTFQRWADEHLHMAQSTQNLRTGARRVDAMLRESDGDCAIHLFGTSAAGSAMLEYFLLTDPQRLYYHRGGRDHGLKPPKSYDLDRRIASLTIIDAPSDWVPLRPDNLVRNYFRRDALGRYLLENTRIKTGPPVPYDEHTARSEDVPGTWVDANPVAGIDHDDHPHYDNLPAEPIPRHIYTGGHMSHETRAFLERVWR